MHVFTGTVMIGSRHEVPAVYVARSEVFAQNKAA